MAELFIHFQATSGTEPYLLSIEAEAGPNKFSGLVRPPVAVSAPKGMDERKLSRNGLEPRMVIPWIAQMAKISKTVVVYDAKTFLRVMDCELSRLGKAEWVRPGIEVVDLADKACCLPNVAGGSSLEEATAILYGLPQDNIDGIKALHEHKEIKTLLELV